MHPYSVAGTTDRPIQRAAASRYNLVGPIPLNQLFVFANFIFNDNNRAEQATKPMRCIFLPDWPYFRLRHEFHSRRLRIPSPIAGSNRYTFRFPAGFEPKYIRNGSSRKPPPV